MKKTVWTRTMALVLLLCMLFPLTAQGSGYYPQTPLYTYSNQRLATRSGPSTNYDETGSYFSAGAEVAVYSAAYDSRNEIWWLQIEFTYSGKTRRAYTGLKRFDYVNVNDVPIEEGVVGSATLSRTLVPSWGPGSWYDSCGYKLSSGKRVDIIQYENGYVQIEYVRNSGVKNRCWVPQDALLGASQSGGSSNSSGNSGSTLRVKSASASSYIKSSRWNWQPSNVLDGKASTAWQMSGTKAERWIQLDLYNASTVYGIGINNGYQTKNEGGNQYYNNARPADITIYVRVNGKWSSVCSATIPDLQSTPQTQYIQFSPCSNVKAIRIYINSYYSGNKFPNDVCISDLMVLGY